MIMANEKERQGDFVFTAQEVGEYRVCFNNEMSTFAEKMVDFEISVSSPPPPSSSQNTLQTSLSVSMYMRTDPVAVPSLQVENESRAQLPSKKGTPPSQTSSLEESIFKVSGQLSTINRNQKYFRTRENRNFSTVRSTEARIFHFSIVESGLMVAMAGLQVFVVRFFFQGARKGYV